jgi:hypothetical protein
MARSRLESVRWWPSEALAAAAATITGRFFGAYHPERHYMRGPGPKTLEKIGGELRARMDKTTKEPLPAEWLTLLRSLETREGKSHDHGSERCSANTRS